MKIVINKCYGDFGLSILAIQEIAKLQGKECYFFSLKENVYKPLTFEQACKERWFVGAFSVPNPEDYQLREKDANGLYIKANKRAESIARLWKN